jgi:hypothetical protein
MAGVIHVLPSFDVGPLSRRMLAKECREIAQMKVSTLLVAYAAGLVKSELEKKIEDSGRCSVLIRGDVPLFWRDRR